MATNAGKSPSAKSGTSNNSVSYSVGDREAMGATTQPSSGGLNKIDAGKDPEASTTDVC